MRFPAVTPESIKRSATRSTTDYARLEGRVEPKGYVRTAKAEEYLRARRQRNQTSSRTETPPSSD